MFQDPDATRESYCLPPILAAARTGPDVSSADSNCFLYTANSTFLFIRWLMVFNVWLKCFLVYKVVNIIHMYAIIADTS